MRLTAALSLALALSGAATSTAQAHSLPHRKPFSRMSLKEVERYQVRALAHAQGVVRFWTSHKIELRREMQSTKVPRTVWWHEKQIVWLKKELARTRRSIRAQYVPAIGDWATAVNYVQRWFPGSSGWLMACSTSEGGHGRWVPNAKGSGAGGWMQYMLGTFNADFSYASSYLRSRGVRVPSGIGSWYSPLGQAVAAGWAYGHNRPSGKWTGGNC